MKQYIGFDVSPLRIGAAIIIVEGDNARLSWSRTHTFKKDDWVTPAMRADVLEDWHEETLAAPVGIGLEAVFIGPNKIGSIRAAMALGQVESISDYEWPDTAQKVLTAAQWRSLCGIKQRGKEPVWEWANAFALDSEADAPSDQDSADAIAIAYAAAKWFENE